MALTTAKHILPS